jgi:hypothetical protein
MKRKPAPDADVHLYRGRELARLTELRLATQAIGDTHATRLAWLVRFIGENPATWHPAVRGVHGDCLLSLARPTLTNLAGGRALPGALTADEIVALHGELRTTVRALLNTNPERFAHVSIPTEGLTERLERLTSAGKKPAVFGVSYGFDKPRTAIFQAVKTLILQTGARLIGCPECQTPFLATHKAKFCTPNCSQRARNKKRIRIDTRPRKTDRRKGRR